jgi:hypothetical protein
MLSALFGPALIILTGLMLPHGWGVPATFADFDHVLAFVRHPLGKLVLLAVIALFFWHGAERMFRTLHDMGAGPPPLLRLCHLRRRRAADPADHRVAVGDRVLTFATHPVASFSFFLGDMTCSICPRR